MVVMDTGGGQSLLGPVSGCIAEAAPEFWQASEAVKSLLHLDGNTNIPHWVGVKAIPALASATRGV